MKAIRLTLVVLLAACLTSSRAQDTWTKKAAFGGAARNGAVGFSIGDKGYMGTGRDLNNSYKTDFWEYDPVTDVWSQKANYEGVAVGYGEGFSIGNKGYVGVGLGDNGNRKDFWEFDPVANTWIQKADFGGTARYVAASFAIGNKGYIGTGWDGASYKKDFWEYDPSNDTWTQIADFGGVSREYATGFTIGSKAYIGTGLTNSGYKNDFWEYDPSTDMWTARSNYPGGGLSEASSFAIGNKGYIGLGYTSGNNKDFWEYDPSTDAWTKRADFGGNAMHWAASFSVGGKGYIGTGFTGGTFFKYFWEYSPENMGIPVITSFSPTSGPIGTTVTITGNNFSSTPANNIVYFGAVKADVTAASPTSISVTVPIGVTYQPITVTNNNLTAYSAQPFVVTFDGGTNAFTLGSFSSKIDFATSSNPYQVMTGDLDGDGRADIITGNFIQENFSVFRNTGTSGAVSFSNTVLYSTGDAIFSPKYIADLDGDGKLDIAFAVPGADMIKVYKNMSSADNISIGEPQNFFSGNGPDGVAFGDINSDGKMDMVSNNFEANTFSVFINNSSDGNISFASKIDFATSANPRSVLIADFNNDGKPDILFVNIFGSNTISVFRNTSDENIISFAAKVEFPTNNADPYMAVGDLDGDNMTDIVVANLYSGSISIFRNTSTNGVINFASKVDFTTVSGAYDISIGDLNGDGKPDLAVLCSSSNIVSIFKNTCTVGTLSFAENVDFSTGSYPTGITIGDFDSDGLSDIAVANQSSTFFSVLRNEINTSEPSCLIPSGLTTTNVMSNSIELYWDDNPEALGYVIKYNTDDGGDNAKVTYSKSNAKPISGLLPGTTYFWRVRSVCSDDPKVVSEWSEKNYFTTTPLRMSDEQVTSMEIYPNPASDKFMLDLRICSTTNQPASIYIMNTLGQVVYSSVETVGNGELSEGLLTEKKVITMPSTVSSGWYVVRVVMSDQVMEKKLSYEK